VWQKEKKTSPAHMRPHETTFHSNRVATKAYQQEATKAYLEAIKSTSTYTDDKLAMPSKFVYGISITHVSGVRSDNETWALNNVIALNASGEVVDTSFKELIWSPQGHQVIVQPATMNVKKLAFATQDAKVVIINVMWMDHRGVTSNQNHMDIVVHWSSQPRDGGHWEAEDNSIPEHWSYTFVDLENLASTHATTWTKVHSNG
jgi:hypothetical protein